MYTLRFWSGGTGPWTIYSTMDRVWIDDAEFSTIDQFDSFELAARVAQARIEQNLPHRYPIGVFDGEDLVLVVQGVQHYWGVEHQNDAQVIAWDDPIPQLFVVCV